MKSVSKPLILGYWNFRGLGQPIRLLLEYVGAKYEEKRHEVGPAPDFSKANWREKEKKQIFGNLPFGNLPYLVSFHLS